MASYNDTTSKFVVVLSEEGFSKGTNVITAKVSDDSKATWQTATLQFTWPFSDTPPTLYTIGGTIFQVGGSPARRIFATRVDDSRGVFDAIASGGNTAFLLEQVPPGTYLVQPELFGAETSDPPTRTVTVPTSETGQDFVIDNGVDPPPPITFGISGFVKVSGIPTPDRGVTMTSGGSSTVTTNSLGLFTFSGLSAGTYRVEPDLEAGETADPAEITVVLGGNVTDQDFEITPDEPPPEEYPVGVTVTQDVFVFRDGPPWPYPGRPVGITDNTTSELIASGTTNEDGVAVWGSGFTLVDGHEYTVGFTPETGKGWAFVTWNYTGNTAGTGTSATFTWNTADGDVAYIFNGVS